jgi:hypothetical protein
MRGSQANLIFSPILLLHTFSNRCRCSPYLNIHVVSSLMHESRARIKTKCTSRKSRVIRYLCFELEREDHGRVPASRQSVDIVSTGLQAIWKRLTHLGGSLMYSINTSGMFLNISAANGINASFMSSAGSRSSSHAPHSSPPPPTAGPSRRPKA